MEGALLDVPLFREFTGLALGWRLPDKATILRSRCLLAQHKLCRSDPALVNDLLQRKNLSLLMARVTDATLIAVPSSTKNKTDEREPEMHQTTKGNQCSFGMRKSAQRSLLRPEEAENEAPEARVGVWNLENGPKYPRLRRGSITSRMEGNFFDLP